MTGRPYKEVAKAGDFRFLYRLYRRGDPVSGTDGAYDEKFEADDIVTLTESGGAVFEQSYHGKTAAFKDMALSILPYLLTDGL